MPTTKPTEFGIDHNSRNGRAVERGHREQVDLDYHIRIKNNVLLIKATLLVVQNLTMARD